MIPRPAFAASYLAVLLALASVAGWAQARHDNIRVRDGLSQRYLSSLDPYQPPRPNP